MKKILCLFSALSMVLISSCSSDDSSSSESNNLPPEIVIPPVESKVVFLKKTITTDAKGKKIVTNYTFNGNKIVSIVDNTGESDAYYTYTGDLITKLEYKLSDGTVEQTNTYAYSADGKLTTFVRIQPNIKLGDKELYTYKADGTILVESYIGDDQTQTDLNSTGTVKFANGEVIEMINDGSSSHIYTYDTKNNPFKNVIGWNKICFTDGDAYDVFHNMLTDHADGELYHNYTYTYNADGFPTTSLESVEKESMEYFY